MMFKDVSTTFKYSTAVVLEMIVLRDVLQSQPVNFCQIFDVVRTFVEEINYMGHFLPTSQDKAKSGKLLQASGKFLN